MSPIPSTDLELGINQALGKVPLKFLIYDFGLSTEHVVRLARDGGIVRYFTPYVKAFPQFEDFAPGLGLEGIEKSENFFEDVDWADVIMFPDIGAGDLCDYLKRKGYLVYGAGLRGENLENHRFETRKLQKELGLPTQGTVPLAGIQKVREFLQSSTAKNKTGWYIKLDKFRGDIESFYAKNYESVETILDDIEVALGPFKEAYLFIAEEKIEGIEPGFDLFFNGTEFLQPYLWGYEYHSGYIGVYTKELPEPLRFVAQKLAPYLQSIDYRGAISVEMIITETGKPYVIDITARFPYPLSAVYTESINNYSQVIHNIALGNKIDLDVNCKYVGCLPLESGYADKHWLKLNFDPKLRNRIKLRMGAAIGNKFYAVKGFSNVVVLISLGNAVNEIKKELLALIKQVEAHGLEQEEIAGGFYKIEKIIQEGTKYGLNFN